MSSTSLWLEAIGSAAKSFEDNLFGRVNSVNDAFTPSQDAFQNFDDHEGSRDYEQRRYENDEAGFGRADDGWRKGYGQTPSHMARGYGQMPPRQEQQQLHGYGRPQHYGQTPPPQQHDGQTPPPQQHDGQTPPPQQHYRQRPQQGGQPPTRPSLPEPRRPSLPPPRGALRSVSIAESFNAGPQRVQCTLNPAAFAAPPAASRSPPRSFLGAEQVGANLDQICRRAAAESAPATAPTPVATAPTPVATADLLGGLDLGGPAPEQAFFEQPVTHARAGELDLLAPAAPAAAPADGSGSFWDAFAPEQNPPAAAPSATALPAQGGAGGAAAQPTPGAADAVRREIRAAAAREDYAEAARLQAELRRLEAGEVGGDATAPLAQEQRGFERGFEVVDESEML